MLILHVLGYKFIRTVYIVMNVRVLYCCKYFFFIKKSAYYDRILRFDTNAV